jgi:energy-coupling factor transporter ATP-binding protein EcfA2
MGLSLLPGFDKALEFIVWLSKKLPEEIGVFKAADRHKTSYLRALQNWAGNAGSDWVGDFETRSFGLDQIFVSPDLRQQRSAIQESLKAVLQKNQRVAIMGSAGAGKSTVVRYITWVLAGANLDRRNGARIARTGLGIEAFFPLRLELKRWDGQAPLIHCLLDLAAALDDRTWLKERLTQGGVFILLDGLDEVPASLRRKLVGQIEDLSDQFVHTGQDSRHANRILVTARATVPEIRELARFQYGLFSLQDLSEDQQSALLRKYYAIWYDDRGKAYEEATSLFDYVRNHSALRRLAGNPLLLSQIAMLHFQGHPDDTPYSVREHAIYEQVLTHLIRRRHKHECEENPRLASEWLDTLAWLAFHLQEVGQYEVDLEQAAQILQTFGMTEDQALERLRQARERYLLRQEELSHGPFSFAHPSFQEYLAARAVCRYPKEYQPVLIQHLLEEAWRQVIVFYVSMCPKPEGILAALFGQPTDDKMILAARCISNLDPRSCREYRRQVVEHLQARAYGQGPQSVRAVEALCWIQPEGLNIVVKRIAAPEWRKSILDELRDMTDSISLYELREELVTLLANPQSDLAARIRLAEALGVIRDPRLGQMIKIALEGKELRVGKFPVTEQEYALFVQETDHPRCPDHWVQGTYPLGRANHPVVNISWQDACAYCEWRSEREKVRVRLPSAKEWVSIAQGDTPDQLYPWGNEYEEERAICRSRVDGTTPVGICRGGETTDGVVDMLGNVWEWTTTRVKEGYIVKGGAYNTVDIVGRRRGILAEQIEKPDLHRPSIGFRVIQEC